MSKHFLDITKDHCPMTFVKVKLKLEDLSHGDELEIVLTGREPIENVPRAVVENGMTIIGQNLCDGIMKLHVKKEANL